MSIAGIVRAAADPVNPWERALSGAAEARVDPSAPPLALRRVVREVDCLLADGAPRNAIDTLRNLHRLDPSLQTIVVTRPEDRARLERAILFAPGLGEVWLVPAEQVGPELIERAAAITAKRRTYRTTRSRVLEGLRELEPHPARRAVVTDAFLAALLDASPDPIIAVDARGYILSWNPGAEKLLGRTARVAEGKPLLDMLQVVDGRAAVELALRGGTSGSRHDLRFLRRDGSTGEGTLLLLPVEAAGRTVRAVILHDLTEERRALARVANQAAQLEVQATELAAKTTMLEEQGVELEVQVEEARTLNAELEEAQQHLLDTLAARQESEERFRLLFHRSPLPTWVYDVETLAFREVNQAAIDRYGYSREEFVRLTVRDIRPPEDLPQPETMLNETRPGGVARWTLRHRRKDGAVRDVEVTTGDTTVDGRPARIAVVLDITERMEAEAATRRSEALFRGLAESIPQLAWMADHDGYIFWYNQRWYDYTGTAPEQMEGWGWQRVHDPRTLPRVLEEWTASLRTGEPFEMEFPLRSSEGEFRTFLTRVAPVKNEAGEVVRWFGTNTDVESLRRAERDVEQARGLAEARAEEAIRAGKRLELLAEAGAVLAASADTEQALSSLCRLVIPRLGDWCAVHLVDDTGALTRHQWAGADAAREKIYAEMVARYPPEIGREDHVVGSVIRAGESRLVPEVPDAMLALSAKDPEHLRLLRSLDLGSMLIVPIKLEQSTLGALTLARRRGSRKFTAEDDALARELGRRAAVTLDRARLYDEALAASRTKTEFLATMSHELRTPLNAMIGYADLLQMGVPESIGPGASSQVERMERAARHLLSIIEEILTFSRIDAGREVVNLEPVDMAELVQEVCAIVEPLAGAKSLEFQSSGDVESLSLVTDGRKLRQILINLLGNSVKFTDTGGIYFDTRREGDEIVFRVRDTGIGVSPEHLRHIFDPFWQADSSSSRAVGGTGLGLAVSRELARLLGGSLAAESELGRGTTFTLGIPSGSDPDQLLTASAG
ncbi:MAG: PAS domain S-box protein [Gemmatimonadetes bacterium]|nr:PAS domain S-box protein [Gemmatimonadota bacterium]